MNEALKAFLATMGAALIGALIVLTIFTKPAPAADLGGNCCADLEERIAELEATVARKGNTKVKLTVSGWVAEQITWWDDGTESNTYIGGIGRTLATHVKFSGEALITPDVSAGFVLHLEGLSSDALGWNQDGSGAGAGETEVLQSFWFLRHKNLGKISVGKQSTASDNAAILVDGSGTLVPANWVMFDGGGFFLRSGGVRLDQALASIGAPIFGISTERGLTWGNQLGYCNTLNSGTGGDCAGVPLNAVRYDTPIWNGVSASASWAEGDFWDAALRYSGEFQGFKVAATAAYSVSDTDNGGATGESKYMQAGLYVEHVATGLWAYGAYGREENSGFNAVNASLDLFGGIISIPFTLASPAGDSNNWYVKGGLRERWMAYGHTVLYAEYGQHNDQLGPELRVIGATDSKLTRYGFGIVQEIDAAAMSLWLKYRHHDGEASDGTDKIDFDAVDFVGAGALINF